MPTDSSGTNGPGRSSRVTTVKPPPFEYHRPTTLDEALGLMENLENAKVLAGGQSLMPMLNMRFVFPDHLVDLNGVPELTGIRVDGDVLEIGALTRQREIEQSALVLNTLPIFREALCHVGHVQTRNRGTIGGSLCHLDPSAELPTVVMALDGEVLAASRGGVRAVPMAVFPAFHMTPAIEPNEIVTGIRMELWTAKHGYAFREFARRHGDFAVVCVAAMLELDDDDRVTRVALAIGGIGHGPIRVSAAEQALLGKAPDSTTLNEAARLCANLPIEDDIYNSAAYRRYLCTGLAYRALDDARTRAVHAREMHG
jgi:aerobic carbon-monoxide dehydrogenase medium subunit